MEGGDGLSADQGQEGGVEGEGKATRVREGKAISASAGGLGPVLQQPRGRRPMSGARLSRRLSRRV